MMRRIAAALAIIAAIAHTPVASAQTTQTPASQPAEPPAFYALAPTPPMGWNSYDAFGDTVTEEEVLANANYAKDKLLPHGWKYIIIDFRWYDPQPTGDDRALNRLRTGARLASDEFGRMIPAEPDDCVTARPVRPE